MKRYFLLGHPLGHSLSRPLHMGLFAALGVKAEYSLMDTPAPQLQRAVDTLRERSDGFNVTIPYKEKILPFLSKTDAASSLIGAVNTVAVQKGQLLGYNTDAAGFAFALDACGIACAGKRAVVLGAGGVARMMAAELTRMGARVDIAARDIGKARRLAEDLKRRGLSRAPGVASLAEVSGGYDLIFNGTPVGMHPDTDASPVAEKALDGASAVFDTIYNPAQTQLMRMAAGLGIKAAGGLVMLAAQAAAAQEIWTGRRHRRRGSQTVCEPLAARLRLSGRNIVLCGMPGSGKTTLGRRVAEATGLDFIDLDAAIEKRHGMSVSDIFARLGEDYFRKEEALEARRAAGRTHTVIATGGGTLLNPQSAAALKRNGLVVFLDAPPETLAKRLGNEAGRPLLRGDDLLERLCALWRQRRPSYLAAADIRIEDGGVEQQCRNLYRAITEGALL